MSSLSVLVKNYKKVKNDESGLYGIVSISKDNKSKEIVGCTYVDVEFGRCFNKIYVALKGVGKDTYYIYNKSKNYLIENVYDFLFLGDAIWVNVLKKDGNFKWQMLNEELKPIKELPNFILDDAFRAPRKHVLVGVTRVIVRFDDKLDYEVYLSNGTYNRYTIVSKVFTKDRKVKPIKYYNIEVSKRSGKVGAIDNNGCYTSIASLGDYKSLESFIDRLLDTKSIHNDNSIIYSNINPDIAELFIKVFSTIAKGTLGDYLVYLMLYIKQKYSIVNNKELLEALDRELSSGFVEIDRYEYSNETYRIEAKIYSILDTLLVIYRVVSDSHKSRLYSENIAFRDNRTYENFKVNNISLLDKKLNTDSDVVYPYLASINLRSKYTISDIKYSKISKLSLNLVGDNINTDLRLDLYNNFIYKPREKKSGNKVYVVVTYKSYLDLISLGDD